MTDQPDRAMRSTYRPGEWFGIFGEHATVVIPPTEKSRVAALWELVDAGAGFDEALDALIASGLRELPGFVLVSERDGETKVVLRGAARATFTTADESVELEGSSATTWVERSLQDVTRMVVEVSGDSDAADLPIGVGLVRISRIDQAAYDEEREQETATVLPGDDGAGAGDAPDDEVSGLVESTGSEEPAGESEPVSMADLPTGLMPAIDEDHDGLTRSGGVDPAPAEPREPGVASRPVARLSFSSGDAVDVDRAVVVGRAPEARRATSSDDPLLVTVPSPNLEISSTHLEVRPGAGADHGSAVVTDLGSTNGTVIVQPGLEPEELQPGVAVQLLPGAIIDLGDGVTIRVATP
ncbi:MAG TPA: FHA domain-containing protein [Nocardioides sp.]|nr:FHA domain-containing protein [Nocardioides sp.]